MALVAKLYQILFQSYGPQGWWPIKGRYHPGDYAIPRTDSERFEICIGAILTQNTSWKNVERALHELRKRKWLAPIKIMALSHGQLAAAIRPAGYFNQKAKKLKIFAEHYLQWKGKAPDRSELLGIWGIGKETVDSMLLYAYKKPVFVIDAYTIRIITRMGLLPHHALYDAAQHLFMHNLAEDHKLYNEYHALLVEHAKRHCAKVPDCANCPTAGFCHSRV